MLRLRFRFLPASLAAAAVVLLTLPAAVSAAPSLVETFHDEGSSAFAGLRPNGVTLVETFTEDMRATTFVDAAGTPVRAQITVRRPAAHEGGTA